MLRTVNAVVKLSVRCCSLRLACPKGPKLYFKLSLRAERGKQASKQAPLNSPNRGPQRTTHNSGPGRSVKFNFPELPSPPLPSGLMFPQLLFKVQDPRSYTSRVLFPKRNSIILLVCNADHFKKAIFDSINTSVCRGGCFSGQGRNFLRPLRG
jgi:hypothetical protein